MKAIFAKLKVGQKFTVTMIQIAIAVALDVVVLLTLLSRADAPVKNYFTGQFISTQSQAEIRNEISAINLALLDMIYSDDASQVSADQETIAAQQKTIEAEAEKLKSAAPDASGLDAFMSDYREAASVSDRIHELVSSGDRDGAVSAYTGEYAPLLGSMSAAMVQLGNETAEQSKTVLPDYLTMKRTAFTAFFVIIGFAFLLTGYVFTMFKKSIVDPLRKTLTACADLCEGRKLEDLHIDSKDEFGEMAASFMQMSNNIEFIIDDTCGMLSKGAGKDLNVRSADESKYVGRYRQLVDSTYAIFSDMSRDMKRTSDIAEQVSAGSNGISSVSQTLSQGTTEQASAVEELSATVKSIAELSQRNAGDAGEASKMSIDAAKGVDDSNRNMASMLEAMNEITETTKEIGKIVKAIDGIAFQTNILALNAAVEAARAGTAGKGFAVVADEVRNLAQRSAEAAKNTTTLVERTVSAVENGRQIADATAKSLRYVGDRAGQVNASIAKIAEASRNQASATEQVLEGIDQISGVVQTNSATAEESASAAEELAAQAGALTEMTRRYKFA